MKPPMWLIAGTGAFVIRVLGFSWRIRIEGEDALERARVLSPRVIFVFWHGRLLPLSFTHRNRLIHVLASEHADGEMLGQTIRRLGFGHVRGSSTRGGTRAILELAERVRDGFDLGVTVDGPRGPRGVVKPGVLEVARQTGAVILPITTASNRHKAFSSWDAFQLPAPFARVVVRYGEPWRVDAGANRDAIELRRLDVERDLTRITEEADRSARA
ncbi:MAG TPA: lysophospholipid acyltransferase family protein [Candidatus Krumholzibacteria bacterium]|nr:lysophospholipid acyltransferase family protein [Candidatus Krumholzibacteria bacterium]